MTMRQLTALIAAAQAKLQEWREEAKVALRAEMERKAAEIGISASELFPPAVQRAATGQDAKVVDGAGGRGKTPRVPRTTVE